MAGLFNFGGVADALMGRKTKKMYVSDPLQGQIDKSISGMDDYRGNIAKGLGDYEAGMKENVAKQKSYEPLAEKELGQVQAEVLGGDYMADRERMRGGDLGSLTSLLEQMGGGMSAADKTAAARLGYAGRPSGTYQDKSRQAFLGAFASPLANTIYSGLNSGASAADAARRGKAGTVAGVIEERSKIPDRATDRMLAVPSARADFYGKEIGALGGLGDVNKQNFMGIKEEKNKWASALGAMDESANAAVDTAMSIYGLGGMGGFMGGGAGGGAIGGLMGGGGGGGGGGGPQGSGPMGPPSTFQPYQGGDNSGMGWFGKMLQQRPQYQYAPPPMYYAPQYQPPQPQMTPLYGPGY